MLHKVQMLVACGSLLLSTQAVAAEQREIGYPDGSLGVNAIMSGDYSTAERQIRASNVSKYDPARALNLGFVLANKGETDKAAKQFRRVLVEENVELVLANGSTVASHEAARRALASLQTAH